MLWWGAANLLVAGGIASSMVSSNLGPFIEISTAAILYGYGVFWAGIRAFEGRAANLSWATAGAVAWLVASQFALAKTAPALGALWSS